MVVIPTQVFRREMLWRRSGERRPVLSFASGGLNFTPACLLVKAEMIRYLPKFPDGLNLSSKDAHSRHMVNIIPQEIAAQE